MDPDEERTIVVTATDPIRKGSIVWLPDALDDPGQRSFLMAELRRIAGHDRFLVFVGAEGGSETGAAVWAPGNTPLEVITTAKEILNDAEAALEV